MKNSVAGRRDPSDPHLGELQGGAGCPCLARGVPHCTRAQRAARLLRVLQAT